MDLRSRQGIGFQQFQDRSVYQTLLSYFFPNPRTFFFSAYMWLASHSHRRYREDFSPDSYAVTRNRTHASRVAPFATDLSQYALPVYIKQKNWVL